MPKSDLKKLIDIINLFENMTAKMVRLGDDLEDIYQALFNLEQEQDDQSK